MKVKVRDLKLGDTVRIDAFGPYQDALVYRLRNGGADLYRPYMTHHDFTYGSEPTVIPLIGHEDFWLDGNAEVTRVRESVLPEGR
jgi:hypothetical protein